MCSSDRTENDPDLSKPEVLIDSGAGKEEPKIETISPIPRPSVIHCKECREGALRNAMECVAMICSLRTSTLLMEASQELMEASQIPEDVPAPGDQSLKAESLVGDVKPLNTHLSPDT